jgi:D-alanine transaminase
VGLKNGAIFVATNQIPLANWNGQILPLDQVQVPVTDRGFLLSEAVYEVFQIYENRLWLYEEHLGRLRHSLLEAGIVCDVDRLRIRIVDTLVASKVQYGQMYLQITGGESLDTTGALLPARAHRSEANELIYVERKDQSRFDQPRRTGISVVSYPDTRWARRDIKSTNLLGNCLAAQAAARAGCFEAVFVEESGTITEGSKTNVFGVKKGRVLTSPLGYHILSGTTRSFVLRLLESAAIPYQEEPILADQVNELDEMFLSGTGIEILGIVQFDGRPIGDGQPGSVTRRIHQEYVAAVNEWLRSR